jgi:hypothetical protein
MGICGSQNQRRVAAMSRAGSDAFPRSRLTFWSMKAGIDGMFCRADLVRWFLALSVRHRVIGVPSGLKPHF